MASAEVSGERGGDWRQDDDTPKWRNRAVSRGQLGGSEEGDSAPSGSVEDHSACCGRNISEF